ncbi:MAG: methylenetetrahydrofolate reductase C-terminal domain-containing protein [Victivallales bacterium]|jgi:methylenetetrahydrofolate reductase (NADPH)|nr:methylenetetrahydrofolate reductase C-terminal domain-containing protein [Victivallales bacterium]
MSEQTKGKKNVNRFRDALGKGEFVLLVESPSPSLSNDPIAAGERLAALEETVLSITSVNTVLALTDRYLSLDAWRALEYANALGEENRDRHVVYLSGRNTGDGELEQLAAVAAKSRNFNLVPVSGNCVPTDTLKECRKRVFSESVGIIRDLAAKKQPFFLGGTVNPYAYTPYTIMGQYFKLVKKLNAGASFVVAQAGWDMLKLQSLRWYFSGRNLYDPMIARLVLLTPNLVEKILSGGYPGVNISPDFRKILEKELRYSLNQFEAAQYRRLELQAAGCRLLGFSGIQLAGAETPSRAKVAAERISNALKEFNSFEGWLEEYNSYLARAEMSPFSHSFYLYDHALHRAYPADETPVTRDFGEPEVSSREKLAFRLRRFWFENADKQPADSRRMLKRIFAACRGCPRCRLPRTEFVCTESCPKKLANGPCGGVKPHGNCEISSGECVHSRILRLAYWDESMQTLEDNILDSGFKQEIIKHG